MDKETTCKECQENAIKEQVYEKDSWICDDCNAPDKTSDQN